MTKKKSFSNYPARVLGFEPRSKVLETSILPLNYTRMYCLRKELLIRNKVLRR